MSSIIEKLKQKNASAPSNPPLEEMSTETTVQPEYPTMAQPHAYLHCPVTYLPPEEWRRAMERLDMLLPMVSELPEMVGNAAGRILMDGDHLQQEMAHNITRWNEENLQATARMQNMILHQMEQLNRAQQENSNKIKGLTDRLYPMAGIAAAFGGMVVAIIWLIFS